jgi:hypothetical protein
MAVATLVASLVIGIIGLYLTHNLRRQQSLRIAEQRLEAYRPLWQLTEVADKSRLNPADPRDRPRPLTREEARTLRSEMVGDYYHSGNGMFLTKTTTELYWVVSTRLAAYARGEDDAARAQRCMEHLSLLRQQMRLDLETISGRPTYLAELSEADQEVLRSAGIRNPKTWGLPWYRRLLRWVPHASTPI